MARKEYTPSVASWQEVVYSASAMQFCRTLDPHFDDTFKDLSIGADFTGGDVESPTGHWTKLSIRATMIEVEHTDSETDTQDLVELMPYLYVLVIQDNSGIVWCFKFDREDMIDEVVGRLEREYERWDNS